MRYAISAVAFATVALASWSPDAGSHGGWGEHGAGGPPMGPPSNGTWGGDSYTTEVVTAYTTYCPKATEITHGGMTYTATEATTLTITNCEGGCTVTKPVSSAPPATETPATPYSPETTSAVVLPPPVTTDVPVAPSSPAAPAPVYPTNNGTAPAPVPAPSGTGSYTSATEGSPIPEQTGNGASTLSAGAAGILAVFGLVAAL